MTFELKDYVEVSERIRAWYEQHPMGRIVTSIEEYTDERVTVRAQVFREAMKDYSPDAVPAGVGHSSLAIPGTTPYTKGSELENAETSAVGRALVMAGIPAKNVSSSNEVESKRGGGAPRGETSTVRDTERPTSATSTPAAETLGKGSAAGGSEGCPDCGETDANQSGLSAGQKTAGFVRCLNSTCGRVYMKGIA